MSTAVLATKLYIPQPRAQLIQRSRLLERLNDGLHSKLILISAPVGFGKTTLVSHWVAQCNTPIAWLSLDEGDSDPTRFLTYLITALQPIAPNIDGGLLAALQAGQPPPTEWVLTALLNAFSGVSEDVVLVLDDYHLIDSKLVDHALTFFLEHLPAPMHVVIVTREDPNLPLARLRASHQLTELRATDLRFTPHETAEFLHQMTDAQLSSSELAVLETRTEGWVAGLQLAVLSMRDHHDVPGFIREFAGDDRYIVDYLAAEVLRRQPEAMRRFLLETSIVERLNGSLCDAITDGSGGAAQLETLQRGNFFLIALDDKRHWYRYHQLFADVLSLHLQTERTDQVAVLHQRASRWYEVNGSPSEAIQHALAATDLVRAADLIERAVPDLRRNRQEQRVLAWLERLPNELVQHRPVLSVHFAGALLSSGRLEGVEVRLRDAERWVSSAAATGADSEAAGMVVVDQNEFRSLAGSIAVFRAAHALSLGDVGGCVQHAQRALERLPEDNHHGRGAAAGLLGLAHWTRGDLEAAQDSYAECGTRLLRIGHTSDAIGISLALADIHIVQGRLRDAAKIYERGLQLAHQQGGLSLRGAADMHVGFSDLERERNDLNAAMQRLMDSQRLGELNGLPQHQYRWRVGMALLRQAQGDLNGASALLLEAERVYVSDFFPNVRPVAALKSRVWLAQGKLDDALDWVRERQLSAHDDLSYLREFEHITLARVLLAQADRTNQSAADAEQLLERLLSAAQAGGRIGSVIEISLLQGLAFQSQGNTSAALSALGHALTLAEPQGYTRVFLDHGLPMARLLEDAAAHAMLPSYTGQLLAEFAAEQCSGADLPPAVDALRQQFRSPQPALEPISPRELQVLRLLASDLSGPEMARKLEIALSTVRTHTKSIFSKLSVGTRRAAVKRATELNLI